MNSITVDLPFEGDASVNHSHYRNGHMKPWVRHWRDGCVVVVRNAARMAGITAWYPPLRVTVHTRFPNTPKRTRDSHNYHKQLLDVVKLAAGIDDSLMFVQDGTVQTVDSREAGCTLEIREGA